MRPPLLLLALLSCCASCSTDSAGLGPDTTATPRDSRPSVDLTRPDLAPPDQARADLARPDLPTQPVTFTGAGDIAWCEPPGVGSGEVTAKLLDGIEGPVFTTGDNSNGNGTLAEYEGCFGPAWGRHLARIRPAPGNHDYTPAIPDGADYHAYFGEAAGPRGKGYYSYDVGAWHVIVLNSECALVGCEAGGAQERWLRADLAAHDPACTLAIMHRPHFSYSTPQGNPHSQDLFAALYAAGVDVLLSGHYHWYERFKPQDPSGAVDEARGIRQLIVGTGGALPMISYGDWVQNSVVHIEDVFGVLKLTLHRDRYDWEFVPEAGKSATDSGSATCH